MFNSKKPKFKLDLGINELSNIPQVSGNCYIDLQIKDNKRIKSLPFNLPFKPNDDDSLSSLSLNSSSTSSSGNVSIITSNKKIHNFKCSFNYKVGCNLKFGFKRRENLINDKFLIMKIYYVSDKDINAHHHHKIELGKLEINLSEYLNFDEPITSKYLLKDSKVNSILSLTIHLSELPSNFDFHTQLTITDNNSNHEKTDQSKISLNANSSTTKYNVPQFERKNIFGGLNDVIGSSSEKDKTSYKSSDEGQEKSDRKPSSLRIDTATTGQINKKDPVIMIDPIVNDLYRKILESTWDPNLHALLDFTPEVCVESIFDGTFPQWKERLMLEINTHYDDDDADIRCINGLVNELNYRDDLKSWTISEVS